MDVRSMDVRFCYKLSKKDRVIFNLNFVWENTAYIFKQIEILVLDKIQIFNIIRIVLRWFKTACYVFQNKTILFSCPQGLRKVLFKSQIDCRTYQTEWQLLIVFYIFLRSPAGWRAEFICTFLAYFRKYEKGFSFLQAALPFCDLIAGSHTFCHSALNSVKLQLPQRLLYRLYRNSYKFYSSCSKLFNLLHQGFDALSTQWNMQILYRHNCLNIV